MTNTYNKIALFEKKQIRKIWYNNEWYFSVVDVVFALTDSENPRDYWYKMKIRVKEEDEFEPSTICRQLKLIAPDGKMRETDCANTEGVLRIIQSIPSPKAEPFKGWLAKVGYERIEEIENSGQFKKRVIIKGFMRNKVNNNKFFGLNTAEKAKVVKQAVDMATKEQLGVVNRHGGIKVLKDYTAR